jgi:predicted NAD/FAD-dependent oxidoreductase
MINIAKLLPFVRKEFPQTPLPQILKAMSTFAQKHPNLTDEQAVQAFQAGMQQARQPKVPQPPFQGLIGKLPTGAP